MPPRPSALARMLGPMRMLLLMVFIVVAASMLAGPTLAQQPAPAPAAPETPGAAPKRAVPQNLYQVIAWNLDPIFFIIFALSVVALTFIIQGFMRTRSAVVLPDLVVSRIREHINNKQYQELIDFTEGDDSFVSRSINPALKRAPHYAQMKEALEVSVAEQTAESFRRIEILNIIGNMGPLLGLLGTVLGMIEAFTEMAKSGRTEPDVLAAGISKALAHTFLGLFLAVPCLMAFGILRQMTDRLTTRAAIVSEELLQLMRPGEQRAAAAATPPRPAT